MGHRALVIYDLPQQYAVAHSHWGAQDLRLEERITARSLRGGSYPEQGLLDSVGRTLMEGDDADVDSIEHVGGNRGDLDVEEPHGLMEKPCSLADVTARHLGVMHAAVYLVNVTLGGTPGWPLSLETFSDVEREAMYVDVTGYRVLPSPRIDGQTAHSDPLQPDVFVARADREVISAAVEASSGVRKAVNEGALSPEDGVEIALQRTTATLRAAGATIPEWSPLGPDVDTEGVEVELDPELRQSPGLVDRARQIATTAASAVGIA